MTRSIEGEITDIDSNQWSGVDYGTLKLKLKDASLIELAFNQNTKGPKPEIGAKVWVDVSDDSPPFILKLSSPDLQEKEAIDIPKPKKEPSRVPAKPQPEFIQKPFGVTLISAYLIINAGVFLLLSGGSYIFPPTTFYILGIIDTVFAGFFWQMKIWARWIVIPLLITFVIYFWWLPIWGLVFIVLSTISIIYLILPATSSSFEAWNT